MVYTGKEAPVQPQTATEKLATADVDKLIAALSHRIPAYRMLATDELSDRIGQAAIRPLEDALKITDSSSVKIHALWVLHRLGSLKEETISKAARDEAELVRVHVMRTLAESARWSDSLRALAVTGLADASRLVRRSAADALGQHPQVRNVRVLLDALYEVPAEDTFLRHMIRIALRNQLRAGDTVTALSSLTLDQRDRKELASVALAVPSPVAAQFVASCLESRLIAQDAIRIHIQHVFKHHPPEQLERVVNIVRAQAIDDLDLQIELLGTMQLTLARKGKSVAPALKSWGYDLVDKLLDSIEASAASWSSHAEENCWDLEPCKAVDGRSDLYLSSRLGGNTQTGVLRSNTFRIPARLQFHLCGHRGRPKEKPNNKNFVRLCLAKTGEAIEKAYPRGADKAELIQWDLTLHHGQQGYLEIVDGDSADSFAWLAAARFDPPVVPVPEISPREVARRQQMIASAVELLRLDRLRPILEKLLQADSTDAQGRLAAAKALVALSPNDLAVALAEVFGEASLLKSIRTAVAKSFVDPTEHSRREVLSHVMRSVPAKLQEKIAAKLAESPEGAAALLELVEIGHASPRLLIRPNITQKLLAAGPDQINERIKKLTAFVPPEDENIQQVIDQRRDGFASANRSAKRGRELFAKHCAACHQVQGQGTAVGPNLDGIGNRGLDRLLEDVLDANRNVDAALYTSVITLKSGRVLTGLFHREEGQALIYVDREGKEFSILKSEIDEQTRSQLSIMPDNLGGSLPPRDFNDLVAYLLSLR